MIDLSTRDELERRLKAVLDTALNDWDFDEDLGVDTAGPYLVLLHYNEDASEIAHRYEVRLDIREVD